MRPSAEVQQPPLTAAGELFRRVPRWRCRPVAAPASAHPAGRPNTVQERRQADAVDVAAGPIDGAQAGLLPSDKSELVHMIMVTNDSNRPIREVTCESEAIQADERIRHEKLADVGGRSRSWHLDRTHPGVA
jgi:hypothetical protein